jgi:hypothetical protein
MGEGFESTKLPLNQRNNTDILGEFRMIIYLQQMKNGESIQVWSINSEPKILQQNL